MDKVFIRELVVETTIGVFDWEKRVRQPLVFDLEMEWDIARAARTDALEDALNYAAVSDRVTEVVEDNRFELLESLLEHLASVLLEEFGMPSLKLKVEKPAVVPQARTVGLEIIRYRKDSKK